MIFWSRQRFEVGAELQLRAWAEALPVRWTCLKEDGSGWVNLRGYVVQCEPERRSDGSFGFRVSLLLTFVAEPEPDAVVPLEAVDDAFGLDCDGRKSRRVGWN
jgi:hypothetical protein